MGNELAREKVAAVVRARTLEVLGDIPDARLDQANSLTDLGANSIDRVEIAALAMQDLDLDFPLHELNDVASIDGLVDALVDHLE
jgi:acyl carrier protein